MKKRALSFVVMLALGITLFAFPLTAQATATNHTIYGYSTTSVRAWGNVSCGGYLSYYCAGSSFSGPATKITVRPKTSSGTNAANATTYAAGALSGGKQYFSSHSQVDMWANTNVYNIAAGITGYWTI